MVRARAGGVDVRAVMRCDVGRGAEVTMRGEYGRYCWRCGDDVEMVVRVHGDRHDMNPHKGQSRGVVVRWHQRDPESNSRRCAEIQNDSSSLGSTPSVVDVHVRNSGSSDESILKSTSGQRKETALACPARCSIPLFMRPPSPSIPEKVFFFAALDQNTRLDGRDFLQARPHDLSFGPELGHVECSLGKTRLRRVPFPPHNHSHGDVSPIHVACWRRWTRRWCALNRSVRLKA